MKANCWATVGVVGTRSREAGIGKAGNTRHRGRRGCPRGGEEPARSSDGGEAASGGGIRHPWG